MADAEKITSPDPAAGGGPRALLLGGIILLGAAVYGYYGIYRQVRAGDMVGLDFLRGCFVAVNFLEGRPLYEIPLGYNNCFYFPPVIGIFLPFCRLAYRELAMSWLAIGHVLALASFAAFYLAGRGRGRLVSAAAASAALLLSTPLLQTLHCGNINIVIFAGLTLMYMNLLRGRYSWAPVVAALAAVMKIAPGLLAAVFVLRRDWRGLKVFLVTLLAAAALSLAVFGVGANAEFLRQIPAMGRLYLAIHCSSLAYVAGLFLGDSHHRLVTAAGALLFAVLAAAWYRRSRAAGGEGAGRGGEAADFFIATVIMTLVAPASWLIYGLFFAFPFYLILLSILSGERIFRKQALFWGPFLLFTFWEFIYYHLPVPPAGLAPVQLAAAKEAWPALYRAVFSLHFLAGLGLFWWALENYRELCRVFGRAYYQEGRSEKYER